MLVGRLFGRPPASTLAVSQEAQIHRLESADRLLTRGRLILAASLFACATLFFLATDRFFHIPIMHDSATSYYAYQASSWLQGRWDIWPVPPPKALSFLYGGQLKAITDLIVVNGKYYSVYGPFPALLMLPLVAVFGREMSDTLFTLVASALNLGLLFLLFEQLTRRGYNQRATRENFLWSVFLYIGSTGLFLSLGGEVWYTGHIITVGCLLLSLLLAFSSRFVWSTVALAAGFLSRDTMIFAFPFLFYVAWDHAGTPQSLTAFAKSLLACRPDWAQVPWTRFLAMGAVVAAMVALFAARNVAMFGNPLESGYEILASRYAPEHGFFSIFYLKANIANSFLAFPHVIMPSHFSLAPTIDLVGLKTGNSVFIATPLFLFLFWRNREQSALRIALWVTIIGITAVLLLNNTSGFPEFGTRYLFDIYPFAWVLLVVSDVRFDWRVVALGVLAILINFCGARQFWIGHPIDLSHLPL